MFEKLFFSKYFECFSLFLVLFVFLIFQGCSIKPDTYKASEAIFIDLQKLVALEVYRDGADFFFKLDQKNQPLYARAEWSDKSKEDIHSSNSEYPAPSVVPIQYFSTKPGNAIPQKALKIPVISSKKWSQLRHRLFGSVLPREKAGLVIYFDEQDYFLFYNDAGEIEATRLVDKPGEYQVNKHLDFNKYLPFANDVLEEFLNDHDIQQTEFIFNTGDEGQYSLPFLYVNRSTNRFVFFRNTPFLQKSIGKIPGLKSGQAFGHLLKSHVGNLYTRPVSSLFRFVTLFSDTVVSTARFEWASALTKQPVPPLSDSVPMNLDAWEQELDTLTKYPQTYGSMDFLVDGEEFFTRYIDVISSAKTSVQLQTYIFDNDDYALQIADLLKNRSKQGVDVKVLLDGFGTITATMKDSRSQPETHISPSSVKVYLESNSGVNVRQKENPWFTSDHVKSTIIDQEIAFVGGMNIGREYRYDWHDMMMELRGPVVNIIQKEFLKAWSKAGPLGDLGYLFARVDNSKPSQPVIENKKIRVLLTSPGNYEIYHSQLEAIRRSQNYIFIQNAYFTNDRLLRELVKARRRGVDVRVIIPIETDHGPITRSNILAINVMLENGIRVYIYPGFSHVKAAVYDGWVCVGSANFDRLSLRINRELNVASSDPVIADQLINKLFTPDFKRSPELTEPLPERWADRLIEILSDYIY